MFLDTSGLYALLDVSDEQHQAARQSLADARTPFTHSYVLAELVPLAQARSLFRPRVLRFITSLIRDGEMEVVWIGKELHQKGHDLLLARLDKKYSLCDAVSFALMQIRHEREALTTDHHFEQEGFVRLLVP